MTLFAGAAHADYVLVEFTTVEGQSLVAAGDVKASFARKNAEATAKRIASRAQAIEQARDILMSSLSPMLASKAFGDYDNFPLIRMDIDETDWLELLNHPQVTAVYPDRMVHPLMESSLPYMGASMWHDDDYTGEGTAVAILDTGIRYWNGFFGDCEAAGDPDCRVKEFLGFATLTFGTGQTDPIAVANASGHGTNCGGIVGDLAPGTDLISLGVFALYDPDSSSGFDGGVLANDGDVAEGLDWCINNLDTHNIVAANMSLGSSVDPDSTGFCTGWMAGAYGAIFPNTRDAGIVPAVATGNDYVKTAVGPPSCISSAMRVGAGYDDPAFGYTCGTGPVVPGAVVCFSNSSSMVDIIAPGYDIDAGGLYGYSGTSMAAPHGAGIVALYAGRYDTDPLWTIEMIRADAVTVPEIGPQQLYSHRYIRVGDHEAELVYDTGQIMESTFTGTSIPDNSDTGIEISAEVTCESDLCASDVAGNVYVDLTVDTTRATDIAIELENPAGTIARYEIDDEADLGIENINSILGSQHLPGVFSDLRGGPIEGTWSLRLYDQASGESATFYKAVLLIDSARLELEGDILAPAVARPDEPFDVDVTFTNTGNLDISGAPMTLQLIETTSGDMIDEVDLEPTLPSSPGDQSNHTVELTGPQGYYEVQLITTGLLPDVGPGFSSDPAEVSITYRTFASFEVNPSVPEPMTEAQLNVLSRGMIETYEWDFGDGNTGTSPSPAHTWDAAGEYDVVLTVTGPDGTSTTARTITVAESVPPVYGARGTGAACSVSTMDDATTPWILAILALAGLALAAVRLGRSRKDLLVLLVTAALSGSVLMGCEPDSIGGDADTDVSNPGPWISILDPADPSWGDIYVWVMLSSEEDRSCDVSMEYRIGEEGDWQPATFTDPSTAMALDSTPEGEEYGLVWEATTDVAGDAEDVQLRVTSTCDTDVSLPVATAPFLILNFLYNNPDAILVSEISCAEESDLPADIEDPYVELTNTTDEDVSLDGWTMIITGPSGASDEHKLEGLTVPANDRLSLTGPEGAVPGAEKLLENFPWTTVSGGAVALVATHERGADFVRWGGIATLPPLDLHWSDTHVLPIPQLYTVLNRVDESVDTDSSVDFCVAKPTPGQVTLGCLTAHPEGSVLVTELDTQGQYDKVEILNGTDERVELGGWILLWDGDDLGAGEIPIAEFGIDAGQRVVLQDNGLAGRYSSGILDLGENLNIDGLMPTAIGIRDPYGRVIDFVAAGGSLIRWTDWVDDGPTPMPGPDPSTSINGNTLSRRPGDPDTNSSADFCMTADNMGTGATACLDPMGIDLIISEVMPGRPDWVEIYNPGPDTVDLSDVYLSYTAPYYGGSVGDWLLSGTLAAGEMQVITERDIGSISGEIVIPDNIALATDGDGSVVLRDYYGFGIDFVMWGEPAGVPLWPTEWHGLGYDLTYDSDDLSIQRYPHTAADTDTRDDWCWATPSPMAPNTTCD